MSQATWSREFLLEFIALFKTLEPLWLIKHDDYYKKETRNECYDVLVDKVLSIDPLATRETITRKINNLRSSFRKEYKKVRRAPNSYVPKLWYYSDLLFLKNQDEPTAPKIEIEVSGLPPSVGEVESEAGMGRRSKAAEALRKRRAEMTEEQRQEVSKKMAADYAARIATETPEQKEMRLSKQRKTSRSRYRNMRAAEDAARRKEVFDKLAAEGGLPERREKRARKSVDEVTEKKYPVRYYRRLANEGQLLVPAHSVALDEPGPSYRALRPVTLKIDNTNETSAADAELARENDSSDGDQDMEDDDERFGAIIAAELRSIDDPEEKETVIAAIKKVLHESRVRRRQKKQIEIKLQPETQSKPVVSVPRPIDDRTEEEKAVSSIKSEPDEPIDDEITPTDESIPNLDCQPETPIPMPVDDRTEEQIAVDAIKEEPVDPSYLGDSSSTFSHPEPDPLCDPAARQPITDITEADAAVAAIKQEPVETYEITISDVNMGDV